MTQGGGVAVLGLGNLLLQDDGIGVWLIRELQQVQLPRAVKTYEIGTAVLAITSLLHEHSRLLLVDAMYGGQNPGSIYRLTAKEVLLLHQRRNGKGLPLFQSLHEFQILDLMAMTGTAGSYWRVFGVEPAEIDFGIGLSPHLSGLIPSLAASLKKEAEKMAARLQKIV